LKAGKVTRRGLGQPARGRLDHVAGRRYRGGHRCWPPLRPWPSGPARSALGSTHLAPGSPRRLPAAHLAGLPNLAVWSAAFLGGPGFAVASGTGVGLFGVRLHPLPALSLLVALPAGALHQWLVVLLAAPVAGGLLAGVAVTRRTAQSCRGAGFSSQRPPPGP